MGQNLWFLILLRKIDRDSDHASMQIQLLTLLCAARRVYLESKRRAFLQDPIRMMLFLVDIHIEVRNVALNDDIAVAATTKTDSCNH